MENSLNSVLIEGSVYTRPAASKNGTVSFMMRSFHWDHYDVDVQIRIPAGNKAELALKFAEEGRVVRIVGRLASLTGLHVVADHIEYRSPSIGPAEYGKDLAVKVEQLPAAPVYGQK